MYKILGIIVIVILISSAYILVKNTSVPEEMSVVPKLQEIARNVALPPSPTPFPFQEMTIPYLRSREYKSQLDQLNKLSENGSYTAYTTSYDSDGLKINGYLTIPKNGNDRHPAIIFIHGYIPPKEYKTTQNYVSYVDYFARRDFVVFKIDLRGHDQSEGEPGGAYYSEDYIIDTLNAYAALESSDFTNPKAIGLWGHSMAGNVVMRSFAAKPEIPAVVVWAGAGYTYSDLQDYRIQDNSYEPPPEDSERTRKRRQLRETYGDFDATSPFWKQVAVTDYLKDLKGSVEVHHATNDNVVSIEYSRNLMKLLDNTSVPHQLYEYQSGGHNLEGSAFTQAMSRSVDFYKSKL